MLALTGLISFNVLVLLSYAWLCYPSVRQAPHVVPPWWRRILMPALFLSLEALALDWLTRPRPEPPLKFLRPGHEMRQLTPEEWRSWEKGGGIERRE